MSERCQMSVSCWRMMFLAFLKAYSCMFPTTVLPLFESYASV